MDLIYCSVSLMKQVIGVPTILPTILGLELELIGRAAQLPARDGYVCAHQSCADGHATLRGKIQQIQYSKACLN